MNQLPSELTWIAISSSPIRIDTLQVYYIAPNYVDFSMIFEVFDFLKSDAIIEYHSLS